MHSNFIAAEKFVTPQTLAQTMAKKHAAQQAAQQAAAQAQQSQSNFMASMLASEKSVTPQTLAQTMEKKHAVQQASQQAGVQAAQHAAQVQQTYDTNMSHAALLSQTHADTAHAAIVRNQLAVQQRKAAEAVVAEQQRVALQQVYKNSLNNVQKTFNSCQKSAARFMSTRSDCCDSSVDNINTMRQQLGYAPQFLNQCSISGDLTEIDYFNLV